jgi:hypothetical protein
MKALSLKSLCPPSSLHGVVTQKTITHLLATQKTLNLTYEEVFLMTLH